MVVKDGKKNIADACMMQTMPRVTTRPMRSEMTPAMIRPLALKTASRATNTNPILMALPDCTDTIFAMWPMIMRPAVAAQAYCTIEHVEHRRPQHVAPGGVHLRRLRRGPAA